MQMESLTCAMSRLRDLGYTADFVALDNGALRCDSCGASCDPSALGVEKVVRFEGASDPGDSAILVAVRCCCGRAGLFSSAYGVDAAPEDALALGRLATAR